jgi:hypothetical protein
VVPGEGRRHRNPAEAVTQGFNRVLPRAFALEPDGVVKLDGDMEFGADYFERLIVALLEDPRLGIVGGRALEPHRDGSWGLVRIPSYHVHGANQLFRVACLREQGGFAPGRGWDTVTIVRARLGGWTTRSLPDVTFRHLRVTGSGSGRLRGFAHKGEAAYRAGYHPLFMVPRTIRNMVRPPLVLGALAFLDGYVRAALRRESRALNDDEIRRFRREQLRALTGRASWWRS